MNDHPINTHCPWSGKPVSRDSTIRYRDKTVAFCNPGCRDKFATAMEMFDAAIEHARTPVLEPTEVLVYEPRAIRFDQMLALENAELKLYHITATPDEPIEPDVGEKAVSFVRENLPDKIMNSGGSHGAGYVVLHRGVTDHWLLMHWWGGGDICLAAMGRLKGGESDFHSVDDTHLHACVWEHVVIAHERDAWVRTMMTGQPDIAAYLEDRLATGSY